MWLGSEIRRCQVIVSVAGRAAWQDKRADNSQQQQQQQPYRDNAEGELTCESILSSYDVVRKRGVVMCGLRSRNKNEWKRTVRNPIFDIESSCRWHSSSPAMASVMSDVEWRDRDDAMYVVAETELGGVGSFNFRSMTAQATQWASQETKYRPQTLCRTAQHALCSARQISVKHV